jgi:hypothetical protein
VRLAAVASRERLIPPDQGRVDQEAAGGQEKPLALPHGGRVLAAVAGGGAEPALGLGGADLGGLDGLLGLPDRADRRLVRDAGHEPVPLVVAAEELLLALVVADQQQEVAVARPHVEDLGFGSGRAVAQDLEELAAVVRAHVEPEGLADRPPVRQAVADLQPGADGRELRFEEGLVHDVDDTARTLGFARNPAIGLTCACTRGNGVADIRKGYQLTAGAVAR